MSAARKYSEEVRHLVWLGLKSYNVTALLSYLDDHEHFVRFMAADELRRRPSRKVYNHAAMLLRSEQLRNRELAAYILSQLGAPRRPYKKQSTRVLLRALRCER